MPKFSALARHQEARFDGLHLIASIVHIVKVSILRSAMDEQYLTLRSRLLEREIRSDPCLQQGLCDAPPLEYASLPYTTVTLCMPPKLFDNCAERRLIIRQTRRIHRPFANHSCAVFNQGLHSLENRKRHVRTVGIQNQDAISHSALGHQRTVSYRELVLECIGIHKIIVIAGRYIRRLVAKDGCHIAVLSVEVSNIGNESSLLQQVRIASEIGDPRLRLFRPGLITIEPLAERPQSQSRSLADQRLMHRRVNHKAVQTNRQLLVSRGFQR